MILSDITDDIIDGVSEFECRGSLNFCDIKIGSRAKKGWEPLSYVIKICHQLLRLTLHKLLL